MKIVEIYADGPSGRELIKVIVLSADDIDIEAVANTSRQAEEAIQCTRGIPIGLGATFREFSTDKHHVNRRYDFGMPTSAPGG